MTHVMCGVMQCGGLNVACNCDNTKTKDASGKHGQHCGRGFRLRRRCGYVCLRHSIYSNYPSHPTDRFHFARLVSWLADRTRLAAFPVSQWHIAKHFPHYSRGGGCGFGSPDWIDLPTFPFHPPNALRHWWGTVRDVCAALLARSSRSNATSKTPRAASAAVVGASGGGILGQKKIR